MCSRLARWAGLAALAALSPGLGQAQTTAELEALYWQRQQAARADYTPADVAFMTGMIGHHAQALVMSRLAPTHGASPAVQRLAARIINAQTDEIESMQRWLRVRDEPVPQVHIDGLMLTVSMDGGEGMSHEGMDHSGMDHGDAPPSETASGMDHGAMGHGAMGHGGMDHSAMPGMLTQAQLEELDGARGPAFDRLFLRYMIQHHGGAITMVDTLFGAHGAAQDDDAFKLASEIHVEQETEIARMDQMLRGMTE